MLPLTAETENILNRTTLSQLQPGALLINVARGRHLVEEDLQPLLDGGQLAAAVLDVFRQEPLPADHPFWSDSRITITPHTAARTLFQETVAQISGKLRALERGEAIAGWSICSADTDWLWHFHTLFISPTSAPATVCRTKSSLCPPPSRSNWCNACKRRV